MSNKIILCVTLDTECDKDANWETRFPLEFTSIQKGIPERLTPLFNKYGIRPTYFLSPEVIQNQNSVKLLSQIINCELGTHLHGEFIEPDAEPEAPKTKSVQAEMSFDIEQRKLQNLSELFTNQFGYAAKSFRAGRFGLSSNSLKLLSDLGYLVDSSVTPFYSHQFNDGKKSNYWGAPVQPYFPSQTDFRKKGSLRILEVPITVINPTLLLWPRFVLSRMHNHSFIHKRLLPRLGMKVEKTKWLRPKYSTAEEMINIADQLIKITKRKKLLVLNMMYHTAEVIPGASPYAATKEDVDYIISIQSLFFDYLFNHYHVECAEISKIYDYVK